MTGPMATPVRGLEPPDLTSLSREEWRERVILPPDFPRRARMWYRLTDDGYLALVFSPLTGELHVLHRSLADDAGHAYPARPATVPELLTALRVLPPGLVCALVFLTSPAEPGPWVNPTTLTLSIGQLAGGFGSGATVAGAPYGPGRRT